MSMQGPRIWRCLDCGRWMLAKVDGEGCCTCGGLMHPDRFIRRVVMTSSKGENVNETDAIRARRDAILAETQADWDEGKIFEAIGVTPEARAEAEYQRLFGSRTGRHSHPVTHPLWLEFTDGDCVVCG